MIHKQCTYNLIICILINLFLLVSFNSYFFCKIYMLYINICCPHRDGPFYFWGGASKRGRLTIFLFPRHSHRKFFFSEAIFAQIFPFFMGHLTIIFSTEITMNIKKKKEKPELTIFFLNISAHILFSKMRLAHNFFSKMIWLTIFFPPKSSRPLPKNKMVRPLLVPTSSTL